MVYGHFARLLVLTAVRTLFAALPLSFELIESYMLVTR